MERIAKEDGLLGWCVYAGVFGLVDMMYFDKLITELKDVAVSKIAVFSNKGIFDACFEQNQSLSQPVLFSIPH